MWAENKNTRALEFFAVAALTACAGFLYFFRLGRLGLWGDEGFSYMAVEGILKHGLPILPSGHGYFKDLLFTYLSALPCSFFGMTDGLLRVVNSVWGVALIPAMYFVGKRFFPAPLAFLGAAILLSSHWEIEFARQARYYCQLQFFYLLSLHFFYRGFVEEKENLQKVALLFFFLATLTHQLAYTLIFSFFILVAAKGPRALLNKKVIFFAIFFIFWVALLEGFEIFFWRVGSVAHFEKESSVWKVLFSNFHWGYFLEWNWLFPKMSWVALCGVFFAFLWRKMEPLSFMVGMGIACLVFMGFGHAHLQPRYIFYLYPIFIFTYLTGLYGFFRLGKRLCLWLRLPAGHAVGLAAMLAVLASTLEAYNPHYTKSILMRHYGSRLVSKFQVSTTLLHRPDYDTPGRYVREHAAPGDVIVGMHMIYNYIYAGRCDYWLWSAGAGTWDAMEVKDGVFVDRYIGMPLLRTLEDFENLLTRSKGRKVWVITTPSLNDKGHILPKLAEYFKTRPEKMRYQSEDGVSKVYLFP